MRDIARLLIAVPLATLLGAPPALTAVAPARPVSYARAMECWSGWSVERGEHVMNGDDLVNDVQWGAELEKAYTEAAAREHIAREKVDADVQATYDDASNPNLGAQLAALPGCKREFHYHLDR